MTTTQKIKSNRTNAQASTGPKTAQGKARAVHNARRHGLSISIFSDPERSVEIDDLAVRIAGEGAEPDIIELARNVASAQIDVVRIRRARHDLLSRELDDPEFRPKKLFKNAREVTKQIVGLMRVSGPDVVVQQPLAQHADHVMYWKPEGAEKFAYILSDLRLQLIAMDRYERRALSRRKFAIRAFDLATRQAAKAA
jgi:hypothetical protein